MHQALSPEIFEEIQQKLTRLEEKEGIRILYACESGSRSWGFASPASDYDIRFIYASPVRRYLQLSPVRDTIETSDGDLWDISGWDLKKALLLLKKGNASLAQWLYSPIVYRSHPVFVTDMRKLLAHSSPIPRLYWAYRSMAQAHITNYLAGRPEVEYKRYLYVVQALLGMQWVETKQTIPPVIFEELFTTLVTDEALLTEISTLVRIKSSEGESQMGPKTMFPHVTGFIEQALVNTQPPGSEAEEVPADDLDNLFLKWIGAAV